MGVPSSPSFQPVFTSGAMLFNGSKQLRTNFQNYNAGFVARNGDNASQPPSDTECDDYYARCLTVEMDDLKEYSAESGKFHKGGVRSLKTYEAGLETRPITSIPTPKALSASIFTQPVPPSIASQLSSCLALPNDNFSPTQVITPMKVSPELEAIQVVRDHDGMPVMNRYLMSCRQASTIVDDRNFTFAGNATFKEMDSSTNAPELPVAVNWEIGKDNCEVALNNQTSYACKAANTECVNGTSGGYFCRCQKGYQGNPYVLDGCEGVCLSFLASRIDYNILDILRNEKKFQATQREWAFSVQDSRKVLDIIWASACGLFSPQRVARSGSSRRRLGQKILIPREIRCPRGILISSSHRTLQCLARFRRCQVAISHKKPEAERNLTNCFVTSVEENRLAHILDLEIIKEGSFEIAEQVAHLAKRCLSLKGGDSPTMKEVAMDLEAILAVMAKHPGGKPNSSPKETDYLLAASPSNAYVVDVRSDEGEVITSIDYDQSMQNQSQMMKPYDGGR
ncbi:hypothetical protein ACLB2K_023735 [Fragaria x ananassa]